MLNYQKIYKENNNNINIMQNAKIRFMVNCTITVHILLFFHIV